MDKKEYREKKDNNIVTIQNKTKNTSNMFDLIKGICDLSGNKIIESNSNLISIKAK